MPNSHWRHRTNKPCVASVPTRGLFLAIVLLALSWSSPLCCRAKEIEATREWTKLEDNDTIPAGMHVRMDLTTGEKFVKLLDDDADDTKSRAVATAVVDASGNVLDANDASTTNVDGPPNYDFDMMQRTLSKLPDDEKARMGGIPELPPPEDDSEEKAKRRRVAEARLQEIWERRQAELKAFEEDHLADLPKILKDRIRSIQEYLEDPYAQLRQINLEESSQIEPPEYGENGEMAADNAKGWIANDIVSVLADLEYHLGDVDMARDFYTLGGWPLLTSLLADAVHQRSHNDTQTGSSNIPQLSEEDWNKVNLIQAHAAWAVGTAVKNTGEFTPYAVDEVVIVQRSSSRDLDAESSASIQRHTVTTTPIDLVMAQFVASAKTFLKSDNIPNPSLTTKLHKTLYAMGALLRGNRVSQTHFCSDQGPAWVGSILEQLAQKASTDSNNFRRDHIKLVQRLLALANDVVSDVTLHASASPQVDSVIQHAFSSETWCSAIVKFLDVSPLYEPTLQAIQALAPHCRTHWQADGVQRAVTQSPSYATWLPKDLDDELHKERMDLLQSTLDAVTGQ